MKKTLMVASILLLAASFSYAQSNASGTTSLAVNVGAEAAIVVDTTPQFISSGIFGNYTGTTGLTYYVRTKTGGSVTVEITTDFSSGGANGGPSVALPPDPADLLTYTCTAVAASAGTTTACSSAMTASTVGATNVLTFGANTQSAKGGTGATTSWTLVNDPNYKAGLYTAVATYTISAS
jgi:hypothetical protein